jgi:spore coat protein A
MNGTFYGVGTRCGNSTGDVCPFVDALPLPSVAVPVSGSQYTIDMLEFQHKLHRDIPATTMWGYNGMFPGECAGASRSVLSGRALVVVLPPRHAKLGRRTLLLAAD